MSEFKMEELIEKYGKRIYNLAYRVCGNQQDAEDVLQETYLQVYKGLDGFRGESDIFTWIYRIALNNCKKIKKAAASYDWVEQYALESADKSTAFENQDWFADPEKAYVLKELVTEIRQNCQQIVLNQLPEGQRVVFMMRIIFDFSYSEISEILGLSEEIIKARLNRARNSIQKHFQKHCRWYNQDIDNCCMEKISFALLQDSELIRKVQMKAGMETMTRLQDPTEMKNLKSIDSIYSRFPMFEYNTKNVKEKLYTRRP